MLSICWLPAKNSFIHYYVNFKHVLQFSHHTVHLLDESVTLFPTVEAVITFDDAIMEGRNVSLIGEVYAKRYQVPKLKLYSAKTHMCTTGSFHQRNSTASILYLTFLTRFFNHLLTR